MFWCVLPCVILILPKIFMMSMHGIHKTSLSRKVPQTTTQQTLLLHTISSLKDKMAIPVMMYPYSNTPELTTFNPDLRSICHKTKKRCYKASFERYWIKVNPYFFNFYPKLTSIHNKIKRRHHNISLFPFPPAPIITTISQSFIKLPSQVKPHKPQHNISYYSKPLRIVSGGVLYLFKIFFCGIYSILLI